MVYWHEAAAQTTTSSAGADASSARAADLEEVIVTAQRRSESASKVPVSVTALTGEALSDHVILKEQDLQQLVPGLTVKTGVNGNENAFALRGQTLDMYSGSAPGVMTYMDEIALPANTEGPSDFYDMASIQVLKGPQGTLFGRNATGGAVLYTSAPPTDSFGGFLTTRFGSYALTEVQGAVNVPVVQGKLDVRLAGDFNKYDGYIKDIVTDTRFGDTDYKSFRFSTAVTPIDDLKSTFVVQYNNMHGTNLNPSLYSVNLPGSTYGNGIPLNTAVASAFPAIIPALAEQQRIGYYKTEQVFTPPFASHSLLLSNSTTYDATANIQFKNVVGYLSSEAQGAETLTPPYQLIGNNDPYHCCDGVHFNQDNWSEELQLLGHTSDNQIKYIVGTYIADQDTLYDYPVDEFGIPNIHYDYFGRDMSQAVFGQGTYDLSRLTTLSGLSFTAGVRYTWETITQINLPDGLYPGNPERMAEAKPSWQFGLQYQVTPAELVYVVTRGSWRAGNFGDGPPQNEANKFRAETTRDVEVGSKFSGKIAEIPLSANVALYDQVTRNVQRDIYLTLEGVPSSAVLNVPKGETKGVEFDGQVRLKSWLTLGGAGAYTFAYFPEPTTYAYGQYETLTNPSDSPRWTLSAFIQTQLPVPEQIGAMTLRADSYTETDNFFSTFNYSANPGTKISGYTLINVRYDWRDIMGSDASLGVYVKNLGNRHYFTGGLAVGATVGDNIAVPGQPLTFGVELNYTF